MKYDFHIHSSYSFDSLASPHAIIKIAKKRDLNGIAITDHITIKGGINAKKWNTDKDFEIIIGAEIKTDFGDIIGLFLNSEISGNGFDSVIDQISSQGGVSILAHPFREYAHPEKIIEKIDLIEGFNARSLRASNQLAKDLAIKKSKAMTAGSDAHALYEIGKGITIIEGDAEIALKKGNTQIIGTESNYYIAHGISFGSEIIKRIFHADKKE